MGFVTSSQLKLAIELVNFDEVCQVQAGLTYAHCVSAFFLLR